MNISRPLHDWGFSALTGMIPTRCTVSESGSASWSASSWPDMDSGSRRRWRLTGVPVMTNTELGCIAGWRRRLLSTFTGHLICRAGILYIYPHSARQLSASRGARLHCWACPLRCWQGPDPALHVSHFPYFLVPCFSTAHHPPACMPPPSLLLMPCCTAIVVCTATCQDDGTCTGDMCPIELKLRCVPGQRLPDAGLPWTPLAPCPASRSALSWSSATAPHSLAQPETPPQAMQASHAPLQINKQRLGGRPHP